MKKYNTFINEMLAITEAAPYYSLEAARARAAKEKAREAAKEAKRQAGKAATAKKKEDLKNRDHDIANIITSSVAEHIPDSDGRDHAAATVSKKYKMHIMDAHDHLDRVAKKHLGVKSYSHYVDDAMDDYHSSK